MYCPFCSDTKFKVTNKRSSPEGIRRRRECLKCGKRFTTYEKVAESEIYVIKKDKTRQKFEGEKIYRGIDRAFEKRPFSKEKIRKLAQEIEEQIRKKGKKEIKTTTIGELIMRKIKKMDKIAYIRFAAVYREFKDVEDFKEVIKDI